MMNMGIENALEEAKSRKKEIIDYLTSLGIFFTLYEHEALFTMDACKEFDDKDHVYTPKNLFLCNRQETKFYLLLIAPDKVFKTKEISSQINSARLSFGSEEKLYELLKVTRGSCTPVSLYYDKDSAVQLLIDKDVLKHDKLGIHPMINTATIEVNTDDLLDKFLKAINHNYIEVELKGE